MLKDVEILDSTLRDGAQGEGISFSLEDKLAIMSALDDMGVKYIEAGNPFSNPKDKTFFQRALEMNLKNSRISAFGSTRRKNIKPEDDDNCLSLLETGADTIVIFGKSWDFHVENILKAELDENLKMIEDTCRFFKERGKELIYDAEHFFDGYKSSPAYAIKTLTAAANGGADCLTLCDTNGGTLPFQIYKIVEEICACFPNIKIGIHCHNDSGTAVANSLMAVEAGAVHVQGTFLGFGERTGNANLSAIIPDLILKMGIRCINPEKTKKLTSTANKIAEICNIRLIKSMPYVGKSAFAHKAGMHSDGVLKSGASFEHINPEMVGNARRFLSSEMMGRNAVLHEVKKIDPYAKKESPKIEKIIQKIKFLENEGYHFEAAEASLELIIRKIYGKYRSFFDLVSYKSLSESPRADECSNTATIKIKVDGLLKIAAAEGNGPVNALDLALREALVEFYPCLSEAFLIDYKVRVIEPKDATAAKVRVLITSGDKSDVWTTIGVSTDIIEASWNALVDSIEYKLCKEENL